MPNTPHPTLALSRRLPNRWDLIAMVVVFGALIAVAHVARGTLVPLSAPSATTISLDPGDAARLRGAHHAAHVRRAGRLAAVHLHLRAPLAAKSRRAEMVLIPLLDILQSVPILGFLTFTVVFFMNLFPGQRAGRWSWRRSSRSSPARPGT